MSAESSEKCPYCGNVMEKGYLIGARGIYWWPDKPLPRWSIIGEKISQSATHLQGGCPNLPANRCTNCKAIVIHAPDMIIPQKLPTEEEKTEFLYTRLLGSSYGTLRKDVLDADIDALAKKGLSRIDAIRQLAKEKGLES